MLGFLTTRIYFTIGLIFLLGYCDYLLTVVGYRLYKKYYTAFVAVEHYELNPFWQKSVQRMRPFDWRHLSFLVALCTWLWYQFYLIVSEPVAIGSSDLLEMSLGFILFLYLIINMGHLTNIYTFLRAKRSLVRGQGYSQHSYAESLRSSVIRTSSVFVLLFVVCLIEPRPFFLGAAGGPLLLILAFGLLARKARKKRAGETVRKRDYFWILVKLIVVSALLTYAWDWYSENQPDEEHFRKGCELHEEQQLEQAIEQYEKSLKRNPEHFYALYNLAVAYDQTGKRKQALLASAQALRIRPSNRTIHELFDHLVEKVNTVHEQGPSQN